MIGTSSGDVHVETVRVPLEVHLWHRMMFSMASATGGDIVFSCLVLLRSWDIRALGGTKQHARGVLVCTSFCETADAV